MHPTVGSACFGALLFLVGFNPRLQYRELTLMIFSLHRREPEVPDGAHDDGAYDKYDSKGHQTRMFKHIALFVLLPTLVPKRLSNDDLSPTMFR